MPERQATTEMRPGAAPWVRLLVALGLPLFTAAGLVGAAVKIHVNGYIPGSHHLLSLVVVRSVLLEALTAFLVATVAATLAVVLMKRFGVRTHRIAAAVLVVVAGSLLTVLAMEFRPTPLWSGRAWEVLKVVQGWLGPLGSLIDRRTFRLLMLALVTGTTGLALFIVSGRILARPGPAARLDLLLWKPRASKIRRWGIALSLFTTVAVTGGSLLLDGSTRPSGPNLLLITVDTLRADHLESYGYRRRTAPNIASLAERGVVFTSAVAQAPWTLSSIATIQTGRYPREHGAIYPNIRVGEAETTLAEYMRDASYATAVVSSWLFVSKAHGFAQGVDLFERIRIPDDAPERSAPEITRRGTRFLRERGAGGGFFLWLHYTEPHDPYLAHEGFSYASDYDGLLSGPVTVEHLYRVRKDLGDPDLDHARDLYDEEISAMDREIGKLLAELERLGLREKTLIALVGDHGEEFGEHGGFGHHHSLYQELLRVPLIIVDPSDGGAGRTVRREVEIRHLARTLLNRVKIRAPLLGGLDLLESYDGHLESYAFSEHYDRWKRREEQTAVLGRGWKLIDHAQSESFELYDLAADPGEANDLSGSTDPEALSMAGMLSKEIEAFRRRGGAGAQEAVLTGEELDRLRSLGYVK